MGPFVRLGVLSAALICGLANGSAFAETCASLRSDLARASASSGPSAEVTRWRGARAQQQEALSAAERDARHFGCFGSNASPTCGDLTAKISRMRSNMSNIERRLARLDRASGSNRDVQRIRRKLAALNCDAENRAAQGQNRGLLSRVFSGGSGHTPSADRDAPGYRTLPNGLVITVDPSRAQEVRASPADIQGLSQRPKSSSTATRRALPSGGTFRTLCVRTCDGFYFPVSFSTGQDQFANDAARCTEICPAAPTALFVHRNPGGMTEDMISLAGIPYSETENAYRFRSEYVAGCSCRSAASQRNRVSGRLIPVSRSGSAPVSGWNLSLIDAGQLRLRPDIDETGRRGVSDILSRPPLARDQLPYFADPDTRANLEGGFDPTVAIHNEAAEPAASALHTSPAGALPVLGRAPQPDGTDDHSQKSHDPVFKSLGSTDPIFQDEADRAAIRVVGPEYFVAQ